MKYLFISIIFISSIGLAQIAQNEIKSGKVSFISSQFVYVKFENTSGIEEGDTLYFKSPKKVIPALVVKHISTTSAACEKLSDQKFAVNDELIAYTIHETKETKQDDVSILKTPAITDSIGLKVNSESEMRIRTAPKSIRGRISTQSYSGFDNYSNRGDYQRWRHSLRLSGENIDSTGLSFSAYSIFAYRQDDWESVRSNIGNALKVYDLNIGYHFDESTRIWLGRYLNSKISNLSTVDGLQFEKKFSSFALGLVAGSRPNFSDFGYNFKLFEYGFYLNKSDTIGKGIMENTISVFEQTNDFKTDRRFIYFQHSNNIIERTSFFISSEIDLYKKVLDKEENSPSLTSVFVSARYAPVKEFSFSLSYDARKNVIYYETFKSFIDSVFENETRQGIRLRSNIRPFRNLSIGLNYGYRYRKSDLKQNTNYGGNISYSNIPLLDFSTNVSFNKLNSSYIEANIYGVSIYKAIDQIYLDISVGFRLNEYILLQNNSKYNERSVIIDFSSGVLNPFYISLGYEGIFEKVNTSGRILFDLSFRF